MLDTSLDWVREDHTSTEHYIAFTKHGRYDIVRERGRLPGQGHDRWKTSRMDHALLPRFDGWCPSLETAKIACTRNYVDVMRADRWLDYMAENDPPR
jgi:hypothetical protein